MWSLATPYYKGLVRVDELPLDGLRLIWPQLHHDARGVVWESYQRDRYRAAGIDVDFVQDNQSASRQGTLRGLHHQPGQAKLVWVLRGQIFDVVVDLRPTSPTRGRWHAVDLDAAHHVQLFIPAGFAHGFCVSSDDALVAYKLSRPFDAETTEAIRWNDPDLAIAWPLTSPILSERDRDAQSLNELLAKLAGGEVGR